MNTDDLSVYNAVTLTEAVEWFGKSRKSIIMAVYGLERKTGGLYIRRSGGVYLVSLPALIRLYGAPPKARPEYED